MIKNDDRIIIFAVLNPNRSTPADFTLNIDLTRGEAIISGFDVLIKRTERVISSLNNSKIICTFDFDGEDHRFETLFLNGKVLVTIYFGSKKFGFDYADYVLLDRPEDKVPFAWIEKYYMKNKHSVRTNQFYFEDDENESEQDEDLSNIIPIDFNSKDHEVEKMLTQLINSDPEDKS